MVSIRKYWSDPLAIELVKDALRQDKLVVGTSDTVLGFLASLTPTSRKFLDETKRRSDKPYIILIESLAALDFFVDPKDSAAVQALLHACWPGPLTVIFRAKKTLPEYIKSPDGTIAIRVPKHAGLQKLLADFPGLFSTSANISGQPIPFSVADIAPEISARVAYVIIDAENAVLTNHVPSTIIDCSGAEVRVIRHGAYSLEQLAPLLPQKRE